MNGPLRILIIDDNPDDRALAMRQLADQFPDLRVEQIAESEGFGRALETGDFDLVITDYQLRWTDGLEVLRTVKGRWPDCPVIMFTGTGNEEIAVEAMKAGLDDYILKTPKHYIRLAAAVPSVLERARQRRALKEAEDRYRELFNGVPLGLYRSAPGGQFLDVNPALARILGYPDPQALMAVNVADLYADPDAREQWRLLGETGEVVREFETQFRRRDGTNIWVRTSARAVQGADGRVVYWEGAVEDITAHKRAEEEQRQVQAQLHRSEKLASLGTLVAGVAHEILNPVNNLSVSLQVLRRGVGGETPEKLSQALASMQEEVGRVVKIADNLLGFSRKKELLIQPLDLPHLLDQIIDLIAYEIRLENIEVTREYAPDLPRVLGDEDQLRQVFFNLIQNARDAMPRGGRLRLRAKPVRGPGDVGVCVAVQDTGTGIPQEIRNKVFDPFFTTKPEGKATGLGLSVSYGIVEAHGGRISLESEEGEGTTFRVELPALQEGGGDGQGPHFPSD